MKKIGLIIAGSFFLFSCAVKENTLRKEKKEVVTVIPVEKPKTDIFKYDVKCKNLKIGVILPLAGDSAGNGLKAKNGVELAISVFNKQNNTEITSVYQDTEGGEDLLEKFYKVSAEDPLFSGIVGPVQNSLLQKVKTLAENYRLVTVSPTAAALSKVKGNQYFFSDAVYPEDEGRVMAEFTVNTLKKKKAAIIYPSNNPYGKVCALAYKEELIRLGGEVTKEEMFEEGSFDYKEQMVSLGGIDPHIIKDIMSTDKNNLESIVSKLVTQVRAFLPPATDKKRNNLVLVKFVNSGRDKEQLSEETDYGQIISEKLSYGLGKFKDTKLSKLAEVKAHIAKNGFDKKSLAAHFGADLVVTAGFYPGSAIPKVAGFIQAYKDTYFEEPDYYSAAAYDAANILLHAIGRGAGSKEEVKNAISNISSIDLVTGAAAFADGEIKKDLHILSIFEKELVEVK